MKSRVVRSSMRKPGFTRALIVATLAGALVLIPQMAAAGVYPWTGGHDAVGSPAPSKTIYFAEGTTRNGFEEYILLRNVGAEESDVTINSLFPEPGGKMSVHTVLQPGAATSVCVNDMVGRDKDVSMVVTAQPGIVAERQMYFNYRGVWTGGHVTSGVPSPAKKWYFAEGTTRHGFQEWLCLQNPGGAEVRAKLSYFLGTGEVIKQQVSLDAHSRKTVDVNAAIGADKDVSVTVEAAAPLVAERPIYFDYKDAWRGGSTVTGATTLARKWYFAEGTTRRGFEEWLCLMNPGAGTTARVEYQFTDGPPLIQEYTLAPHARTTLFVNQEAGPERDVSIKVTSDANILCERPMYFRYKDSIEGGHVVLGSRSGSRTWYFPTAAVGPGFESWLCLMNPGSTSSGVEVEVLGDEGARRTRELSMRPQTRATVSLNELAGDLTNSWVRVTSAARIIAERPAYFSYEPKVVSEPFTFATWNGVELKSPIRYEDLLGPVFHQASAQADGGPSNAQALQPVGTCLQDDNPGNRHPGIVTGNSGDPAYFIEESRGRGTYSTTACDVQSKTGAQVFSPVNGTVLVAEPYMLYGSYPDLRVRILIDGQPGYFVAALHLSSVAVARGQRVEAGRTVIGTVRDLVPYFHSGPNPYTREDGNHTHIEIEYRPDMHL